MVIEWQLDENEIRFAKGPSLANLQHDVPAICVVHGVRRRHQNHIRSRLLLADECQRNVQCLCNN